MSDIISLDELSFRDIANMPNGDLQKIMHKLAYEDPSVLEDQKPERPKESVRNYELYEACQKILNSRYKHFESELRSMGANLRDQGIAAELARKQARWGS